MGKTTIEWTATVDENGVSHQGYSFNAWVGCTKVSPACDNCYAESWAKRSGSPELWQGERRRTTEANWRKPIKWNAEAEKLGIRYKVFCNSLADIFDNEIDPEWFGDLWRLIRATRNLDWLLLTKRIGNAVKMWPGGEYKNVWLGATVINQEEANRDIPKLLAIPAAVRFLSIEPMLGPIDLRNVQPAERYELDALTGFDADQGMPFERLDWIICGGESGPNARLMEYGWAADLRDQCRTAGVPFFMKQMTKKAPIPDDLMVRQFPRAA